MNTTDLKYLNKEDSSFNPEKHCGCCKCNGSVRKHKYYFAYNRSAKVCIHCQLKFSNPSEISDWLEKNAVYSRSGKLVDFKKNEIGGN